MMFCAWSLHRPELRDLHTHTRFVAIVVVVCADVTAQAHLLQTAVALASQLEQPTNHHHHHQRVQPKQKAVATQAAAFQQTIHYTYAKARSWWLPRLFHTRGNGQLRLCSSMCIQHTSILSISGKKYLEHKAMNISTTQEHQSAPKQTHVAPPRPPQSTLLAVLHPTDDEQRPAVVCACVSTCLFV